MNPEKKLLVVHPSCVPTGQVRRKLERAGYIILEATDPNLVRVVTPEPLMISDDLIAEMARLLLEPQRTEARSDIAKFILKRFLR